MKKKEFLKLVDKLKGLNYCFFSGIVMFMLTNGKRKFKDIDILIDEKDMGKLAERFGVKPQERRIDKGTRIMEDISFETNFLGFEIEAITNKRSNREDYKKIQLILKNKVKKKYLGVEIFIEPIEELIARKSFLHRDKDLADLQLIKNEKINQDLLNLFAENWKNKNEILDLLKKIGYKIK